jgi:hypothetical protein
MACVKHTSLSRNWYNAIRTHVYRPGLLTLELRFKFISAGANIFVGSPLSLERAPVGHVTTRWEASGNETFSPNLRQLTCRHVDKMNQKKCYSNYEEQFNWTGPSNYK